MWRFDLVWGSSMDKPLAGFVALAGATPLIVRPRMELVDAKSRHPHRGPSPGYAGRNPRLR